MIVEAHHNLYFGLLSPYNGCVFSCLTVLITIQCFLPEGKTLVPTNCYLVCLGKGKFLVEEVQLALQSIYIEKIGHNRLTTTTLALFA